MTARKAASPQSPLEVRLAWLMGLRLSVITVFLVVTGAVYTGGFAFGGFSSRVVLFTVATAYGAAALYAALLRRGRGLRELTMAQLCTDQLTWTAIVYVSGGVASGATSLYGLTCLSGAILLGARGALGAAAAAMVSYGALCVGFGMQWILPPLDQTVDAYATHWGEMMYPAFVNVLGVGVVTLLASYLAERLRTSDVHLIAANQRAEQAEHLAILGRVAAALAHEIRNPLGAISASIELLGGSAELSGEDRQLCTLIKRETVRLNDLVGDMLDLSRPRPPAHTWVDLARTSSEIVTLASSLGRDDELTVTYEGPESVSVWADAAQMRQVIWNLVRNAIQASGRAGTVTISLRDDDDGGHTLAIRDLGSGIPSGMREQVFDAFFTTRAHGVGIGLAVVRRIVSDHGFDVQIESEEGAGTTFSIHIPASPRAPASTA